MFINSRDNINIHLSHNCTFCDPSVWDRITLNTWHCKLPLVYQTEDIGYGVKLPQSKGWRNQY